MRDASAATADVMSVKADSYWSTLALHKVPPKYLLMSAFVSYVILAIGYLEGVTPWIAFGLALAPWGAIVFFELEWSYKHFGWFALFGAVTFVQLIHYSEHCIQVIQVHFFGDSLHDSQAIFGSLQREWVHFTGDTVLTIGTLLLLVKFPRNPWLWVTIPFQILHQAEHTYLIYTYVVQHFPAGGPGLLSSPGGVIGGGVGLNRPDLHWIYNTLYTIPLALSMVWQLKRTYDESLDEAFPEAPKAALLDASHHMETFRYEPTETVLAAGDDADRLYIVVEGEAGVYEHDSEGRPVEVATLHHGEHFGEAGLLVDGATHTRTVRAKTALTLLAMDDETFGRLVKASQTGSSIPDTPQTPVQVSVPPQRRPAAKPPASGPRSAGAVTKRAPARKKAAAAKPAATRSTTKPAEASAPAAPKAPAAKRAASRSTTRRTGA